MYVYMYMHVSIICLCIYVIFILFEQFRLKIVNPSNNFSFAYSVWFSSVIFVLTETCSSLPTSDVTTYNLYYCN